MAYTKEMIHRIPEHKKLSAENEEIVLHRKKGPPWVFKWQHDGFYHFTQINTYRLFFENPLHHYKPFWIGRKVGNNCWYTVEKIIGADYIEFCGSRIVFEQCLSLSLKASSGSSINHKVQSNKRSRERDKKG